ncbi:MAG TPA: TetR/AcrR family transcriptional regulator [Leptospiraceae bacterium]|nr:TetR/AcrR family transcriptional regulator [Leptospiraceae bacterium]
MQYGSDLINIKKILEPGYRPECDAGGRSGRVLLDVHSENVDTVYMPKPEILRAKRAPASPRKAAVKSYHHGDLRSAVLDEADRLLEKHGIENLSLRDVAQNLGVSHAAPYRHFPRKLDLLLALAEKGFSELGDAMEKAFTAKSPEERFQSSGLLYVKLAVAHPVRTQLMFSKTIQCDDAPDSLQQAGQRAFQGLVSIIEDGQKAGEFKTNSDAMTLAVSAWSMVHGIAGLISGGQLAEAAGKGDGFVRTILSQLYSGVRKEKRGR